MGTSLWAAVDIYKAKLAVLQVKSQARMAGNVDKSSAILMTAKLTSKSNEPKISTCSRQSPFRTIPR